MVRPAFSLSLALLAVGAAWACAATGPQPHRGVQRLWRQFLELPEERALALAGDPERVWVAGVSGGHEFRTDAEASALGECQRRRALRRLQAPCRLYAVGNEIVWERW